MASSSQTRYVPVPDPEKDLEKGLPIASAPPGYAQPPTYSQDYRYAPTATPAASAYAYDNGYQQQPILQQYQADGFTDKYVRQGFLRKVLGLLCAQLAVTAIIASAFVLSDSAKLYLATNPWTLWVAMGLSFAFLLVLLCSEGARRSHPTNLILLFAFTICESVLVGAVSASYDTDIVLLALAITATVTGGLMVYALQTKHDFTTSGGMLLCVLISLVVASFIGLILHSRILNIVIAAAGALVFSAYIVFDVQLVASGQHMYQLSPDEYVVAAINIYLDILNLFLYILQLLQQIRND